MFGKLWNIQEIYGKELVSQLQIVNNLQLCLYEMEQSGSGLVRGKKHLVFKRFKKIFECADWTPS